MNPKIHFQGHMVWERLGDGALRTGDYILEDMGRRSMLRHVSGRVVGWFSKVEATAQDIFDAIQDDQRFVESDQ